MLITEPIDPAVQDVLRMQREAESRGHLDIWVVYDRPKDWPHGTIARRHEIAPGESALTEDMLIADLEELQRIFHTAGLVQCPRKDEDDPKIVESWV